MSNYALLVDQVGDTSAVVISDANPMPTLDSANAVLLGDVNETPPNSDTDPSGLNGRLQRIAQHLSTLVDLSGDIVKFVNGVAPDQFGNAVIGVSDIATLQTTLTSLQNQINTMVLTSTLNDGQVKINGTTQSGSTVKPSWVLVANVARRVNLPVGFPLAKSSSPTTSWPNNDTVKDDTSLIVQTFNSGTGVFDTTFLENKVSGQVHTWRLRFTYSGKASSARATVFTRIFNSLSGFTLLNSWTSDTGATSVSGELLTTFISIADGVSLPSPFGTGIGYGFEITSDAAMTVTLDSIVRVSSQFAPRV